MFFLFSVIISVVLGIVDGVIGSHGIIGQLYSLAVLVPSIAVGVRRMHDTNHSGWFLLIPIYNLILAIQEGQPVENGYGSNPKAEPPPIV